MINGDKALLIRRTWMTKIFVAGDVFSFFLQAAGGGIMASGTGTTMSTGKTVIVAGLFVQVLFFGCFVLAARLFHLRMNRTPSPRSVELSWWKRHMTSLYIVSMLIFARSIIRVVEYLQGF